MRVINKGIAEDGSNDLLLEVEFTPEEAIRMDKILNESGLTFQEWAIQTLQEAIEKHKEVVSNV